LLARTAKNPTAQRAFQYFIVFPGTRFDRAIMAIFPVLNARTRCDR